MTTRICRQLLSAAASGSAAQDVTVKPRQTHRCWMPALLTALCVAAALPAARAQDAAKEATRWITASQVNLRDQPGLQGSIVARLPLAARVRLIALAPNPSFCEVEAEGLFGFVACRYLGTSAPPAAGPAADASNAGQRWVSGSGVNLRAEPTPQSAVIGKLALNAVVRGVEAVPGSGYCKVQTEAATGYTACQYLASAPLALDRVVMSLLPDGQPNPAYDPVRSFWLAPSWPGLEAVGQQLLNDAAQARQAQLPAVELDVELPRPPNAEFDRMKAHLAKGIYGAVPTARTSWDDIKRLADSVQAPDGSARAIDDARRYSVHSRMRAALHLWSADLDVNDPAAVLRLAGLVNTLELPTVAPSLFKDAADVAGPGERVEDLSGRFHIVHTYRTRGRELGAERGLVDGLWDVGQVTVALTQPLVRTTVFRDGRLRGVSTHASETRVMWGRADPPMCDGQLDGFAFGHADPRIWRYFGEGYQPDPGLLRLNPPGSLLSITTRKALPAMQARPVITTHKLDRSRTGFVRGTWMHFDLDADGVIDLAVWEGVGRGPGHLGGQPDHDDPYHRLFMVNIAGRWQMLGADSFSYGCGC